MCEKYILKLMQYFAIKIKNKCNIYRFVLFTLLTANEFSIFFA